MDFQSLDENLLAEVKILSEKKFWLENEIQKLSREFELLGAKRKEVILQSGESEIFTKRVKKDFDYYLEEKNKAVEKIEGLKGEIKKISQKKKDEIGNWLVEIRGLEEQKVKLEQDKERIVKEKDGFVKSLESKEAELKNKEVELEQVKKSFEDQFQELSSKFIQLELVKQDAFNKAKEADKIRQEAEIYLVKIQKDKDISADLVESAKKRLEEADRSHIKYRELIDSFKTKELELQQQNEALSKTKDYLAEESQRIAKDRRHLESQQQVLKSAFEEARNKNLL